MIPHDASRIRSITAIAQAGWNAEVNVGILVL